MTFEVARETTLDRIIAKAIEDAREEAIKEATRQIEEIGGGYEVKEKIVAEMKRLLAEDPEIKQKIREALIRAIDAPPRRGY